MQSLEDDEDPVEVLRIDADPVIANRKHNVAVLSLRGDVDVRRRRASVFYSITEQILKDLGERRRVGRDGRQGIARHARSTVFDRKLQVLKAFGEQSGAVRRNIPK